MKKTIYFSAVTCALLCLVACGNNNNLAVTPEEVHVVDLAHELDAYKSLDSLGRDSVYKCYRPEIDAFMHVLNVDSVSDDILMSWSKSLQVEIFTPPVDSVFSDRETIAADLGHILGAAKTYGLELPSRRYATVVSGNRTPVIFTDSVVLISLNHFLGAEYEGYGSFPAYLRAYKTPEQLKYTLAEGLVALNYPYGAEGETATLLSRMLYEGALVKVRMSLVKDSSYADAVGYNGEDMAWIDANEALIWKEIVASGALYDTSVDRINRFVAPSPAVRETPTMLPGRIGRYVGYKIVEAYCRRHPDATLPYLLSPEFYNNPSVLSEAGYSPR